MPLRLTVNSVAPSFNLAAFMSLSYRLRSLNVCISVSAVEPLLHLPAGSLPVLEELRLSLTRRFITSRPVTIVMPNTPTIALAAVPRLRSVAINNLSPEEFDLTMLRLPWSALKYYLELKPVTFSTSEIRVILNCINIGRLVLRNKHTDLMEVHPTRAFPNLRSLELTMAGASKFLDLCTLPSLSHLRLRANCPISGVIPSFIRLSQRSSFRLRSFALERAMVDKEVVLCMRGHMRFLTSLELVDCLEEPSESFIKIITYDASDPDSNIFPALTALHIIVSWSEIHWYHTFTHMVGSRWWPDTDTTPRRIAHLQFVRLGSFLRKHHKRIEERLRTYRLEGLDVTYRVGVPYF